MEVEYIVICALLGEDFPLKHSSERTSTIISKYCVCDLEGKHWSDCSRALEMLNLIQTTSHELLAGLPLEGDIFILFGGRNGLG